MNKNYNLIILLCISRYPNDVKFIIYNIYIYICIHKCLCDNLACLIRSRAMKSKSKNQSNYFGLVRFCLFESVLIGYFGLTELRSGFILHNERGTKTGLKHYLKSSEHLKAEPALFVELKKLRTSTAPRLRLQLGIEGDLVGTKAVLKTHGFAMATGCVSESC